MLAIIFDQLLDAARMIAAGAILGLLCAAGHFLFNIRLLHISKIVAVWSGSIMLYTIGLIAVKFTALPGATIVVLIAASVALASISDRLEEVPRRGV